MDLREEFERAIEGMEWGELVSILEEAVLGLLGETSNPPPPSSSPPPPGLLFPVGPHFSTQPQTVGGQSRSYGPCVALEAAPVQTAALRATPSTLKPAPLFSQAGAQVQVQNANIPVVRLPENILLCPIGMIKSQNDSKYITKPPNAFMLFLKEHRPKIQVENSVTNYSVTVNKVAGAMWRSLTKEQKSKYHHQARVEKRLHKQENPEWSCKDNYGKRGKKRMRGSLSRTEDSKRLCVPSLRIERPSCQSDSMQPHQAVWWPHTETPVNVLPVLHLPQVMEVCSAPLLHQVSSVPAPRL